jgi:hypothetical protein
MDYMEQSTMHIKAPHPIHIGAKVMAAKRRTSMNQYVIDLIRCDLEDNDMPLVDIEEGISIFNKATPKQKQVLAKASKVVDDLGKVQTPTTVRGLCEHFQPKGECLQKGCKYGKK